MITKFENFKLITEDPDYIDDNGHHREIEDDDAMPFCMSVNGESLDQIYYGREGTYHADMKYQGGRNRAYPGRMWKNSKLMSFWVYPSEKLFKSIIERMEKDLDIKIFNNGWRIQVITWGGKIKRRKVKDDLYMAGQARTKEKIIPLEEYAGSENVPVEKQIQHLMNWKEKELAKAAGKLHFGGFGSSKTAWDQPHNIRWRQALYQENKNNNDN